MRHERRILVIGNNDPRDSLRPCVGVEGIALLLDVLALTRVRALGDGFAEERHEFADAGAGEAGVGGEVALGAEFDGGFAFVLEDLANTSSAYGFRVDCVGCLGGRVRTPM